MTSISGKSDRSWSQFSARTKAEYLRESAAWEREQRRRLYIKGAVVVVAFAAFAVLVLGFGGTTDFVPDVREVE